jgi:hypothetical protein
MSGKRASIHRQQALAGSLGDKQLHACKFSSLDEVSRFLERQRLKTTDNLNSTTLKKSPGSDSFTSESYQTFQGEILINSLQTLTRLKRRASKYSE